MNHLSQFYFPDPRFAPRDAPLAIGGDLSPEQLLCAYSQGIFPWYDADQPILWWSPDPRFVLEPANFSGRRSLRRALKREAWEIQLDTAFTEVMQACANVPRPNQEGTWITSEMIAAYARLHELGLAHSLEVRLEGSLVGGVYGVSLGAAFFAESMFHRVTDASKVALHHLCELAKEWNFSFIDCQVPTEHLRSLGAEEWPRQAFLEMLQQAIQQPTRQGRWSLLWRTP